MDALLNWLWQGCAFTAMVAVLLRTVRVTNATTRYYLWWITLLLVVVLPAAPAVSIPYPGLAVEPSSMGLSPSVPLVRIPRLPRWLATCILTAWTLWAGVAVGRLTLALLRVRDAKRRCRAFPSGHESKLRHWMSVRSSGRSATLALSDEVRSAAVLGLASPVIALAPALLRELDAAELDHVVVHEWAHVQRRDDVASVIQLGIDAAAGLHPAVWWITRRLTVEREVACDDWVVSFTGSAKVYASTLLKLATAHTRSHELTLAPGALAAPHVTTRIERLLHGGRNGSTRPSLPTLVLVAPVMLFIGLTVCGIELVGTALRIQTASWGDDGGFVVLRDDPVARTLAIGNPKGLPPHSSKRAPGEIARSAKDNGDVVSPRVRPAVGSPPRRVASLSRGSVSTTSAGALQAPTQAGQVVQIAGRGAADPQSPLEVVATRAAVPLAARVLPHGPGANDPRRIQDASGATPWGTAAEAGVAVGRSSQRAALATADFFTTLGKSIAGVF